MNDINRVKSELENEKNAELAEKVKCAQDSFSLPLYLDVLSDLKIKGV